MELLELLEPLNFKPLNLKRLKPIEPNELSPCAFLPLSKSTQTKSN